jgi:peptidoglycan-associated lipoprotein
MRTLLALLSVPPMLLATGCHHEKPPALPPTATNLAEAASPAEQPVPKAAAPKACTVDLDCGPRQLCLRGTCTDITADLAECRLARVYFAYDSALLRSDDLRVLQRMARCLRAEQALTMRVEGNADERGTTEYNLALGDRRARSVTKYLGDLGVTAAQLSTVSYGEEKPLCLEHGEQCWSKNRRAAVKPRSQSVKNGHD